MENEKKNEENDKDPLFDEEPSADEEPLVDEEWSADEELPADEEWSADEELSADEEKEELWVDSSGRVRIGKEPEEIEGVQPDEVVEETEVFGEPEEVEEPGAPEEIDVKEEREEVIDERQELITEEDRIGDDETISDDETIVGEKEEDIEEEHVAVGQPEVGQPEAEDIPETEPERKSASRRFMYFLFGKESRVGRVMRPVLRTTALIVGMLAAGLLLAYFLLYLPVRDQRDQALTEIQNLNLQLENTRAELEDAEGEVANAEAEMATIQSEADAAIEELEGELEMSNFRVRFLIVKNDVLRARMALLDGENGPGGPSAMAALNDVEEHLEDLNPYVEEVDPVLADLLENRLNVVRGEFARDARQARAELESFYANLLELEDTLFR